MWMKIIMTPEDVTTLLAAWYPWPVVKISVNMLLRTVGYSHADSNKTRLPWCHVSCYDTEYRTQARYISLAYRKHAACRGFIPFWVGTLYTPISGTGPLEPPLGKSLVVISNKTAITALCQLSLKYGCPLLPYATTSQPPDNMAP